MSSSSTETTIDLSGFTAHCHINDDGEHTTSCIENLSCLRYKMAPRVPLVWKADRVDIDNIPSAQPVATLDNARPIATLDNARPIATLDNAQPIDSLDNAQLHQELYHHPWGSSGPWAKQVIPRREPVPLSPPSREWQARTRADPRLLAPGFPIPRREPQKPASPVPEFPRPSSDWATSRQAPQSSPWQYPQTSEWQARTLADPRVLAPGCPLPIKEKPAASPAPTTRPPPGLNVEFNTAELVQPKPVQPCGNPQPNKMADFLARYSPKERDPSLVEMGSQVLHPESDYNPWA